MNKIALPAVLLALLAGCASAPTGPNVMVLPGAGKSFDQFRYDDYNCRQYAQSQINPQAGDNAALKDAAIGTVVGAAAGAAIGGHQGAGVGAGTGLIAGSMIGSNQSEYSGYSAQRQYDQAYTQCMYAKGNQVPVNGRVTRSQPESAPAPSNSGAYYPPPPPPGWHN